jgi:hypothetical protein
MTTRRTRTLCRLLLAAFLVAAASGCFGPNRPIEFYTLSPMPRPAAGAPGNPAVIVALTPAAIPAAIDRPQIVTRPDENRVEFSEFHRWGGTLKADITRILIENLDILLADRRASVMADRLAVNPAYLVSVTFNRFDGRLGESVQLHAAWTVRDMHRRQALAVRNTVIEERIAGPGYADLVAAQSRALGALSREIAAELGAAIQTP